MALDLPHSCPECDRTFPTTLRLAVHRSRWCRSGQRDVSRLGQRADIAVKLVKRQASAALIPPVVMEGESLESVYQFDYLGCLFTSDEDDAADMRNRMAIAGERSRGLDYLWRNNRLPRSLKLLLYPASARPSGGCADAEASLAGPCPADACRPPTAQCGVGAGPKSWTALPT